MKTIWTAVAAVALLGAVGCEQRDRDRFEDRTDRTGDRIEDRLDRTGDRLEQAGKDLTGGVAYEVAKIDKEKGIVEVRRANALPGVTDKKDLQSGMDSFTFTFAELEMKVEGDKAGKEIADELHVGENVHLFIDGNKNVTKITY
jgi:hypothetical protein